MIVIVSSEDKGEGKEADNNSKHQHLLLSVGIFHRSTAKGTRALLMAPKAEVFPQLPPPMKAFFSADTTLSKAIAR